MQTFLKKAEYCFLVESTKIENAAFSYKTAMPEPIVKTNSMGSTKWTYHIKRRFTSNYFFEEPLIQS